MMVPNSGDLVGRLRSIVATELAQQAKEIEAKSGRRLTHADLELLARDLLNHQLDKLAHDAVNAGNEPLDEHEEQQVADAVLARLFALGRLQPLLDDDQIMNIYANSFDRVMIEYSDGLRVPGPPPAYQRSKGGARAARFVPAASPA